MKIIDNSTMTPVLKVGTPPREYGSEEIKLGIPGIRGESDQTLPPSERDESGQTPHEVGDPEFPGRPELPERDESEQVSHEVFVKDNSFDNTIVSIVSTRQLFYDQLYDLHLSGKINGKQYLGAAKEYDSSHGYISPACTHLTLNQLNRDGQLSDGEYESLLSKYECVPKEPELL